ncbi:glucose-1-phosphate cytidylyltransferase [Acetobacter fallax]|uniref:Glucose-1-phosphate cytidylyltransferase n=1 Tax=Acetobacter fallax TaxID=1737473 RepID=A0ABX0KDJ6_9PROT|nr:glucose-1-phosphate cytidylyltransferase [Acetobacter fallax]NHO33539.1 glucose-1-phosphate cytidylyltransferase [Acetobacter fallax]NHO36508.1 glucose-1-phosphate cytidylyltransferase [Acetobacter fallax]
MKAVILSGGYGTRLMEETEARPKPMVEIGGKPILWHIMKIYANYGINDFVIPLGYKADMIKRYFVEYYTNSSDIEVDLSSNTVTTLRKNTDQWKVTLVDTGIDTMTGGRLLRLKDHLRDGDFCLTYGDGVTDLNIADTIRFHQSHGKISTVTAVSPPARFGSLDIRDGKVMEFHEKPEGKGLVNGGFFVLSPGVFDYLEDDTTVFERGPLEKLAEDKELMAIAHEGFWYSMDTLRDKRHLDQLWTAGQAPWKVW